MKDPIYLAQTDTTAGFLCKDYKKLNLAKGRDLNQPILIEVDSLQTLKTLTRVPSHFKNHLRRLANTSFIFPNHKSFRVIRNSLHLNFLTKFNWLYSTSANKAGQAFDYAVALSMCDILIEDERGIFESKPSTILKINKGKAKKIR